MDTVSDTAAHIATEPDAPELINVTRFIVIVALFVAVSLVSLRSWLGGLTESTTVPTMTTPR